MNVYHVYRSKDAVQASYDDYVDFVVVAESLEQARNTYPFAHIGGPETLSENSGSGAWVDYDHTAADCIGVAAPEHDHYHVVMSSNVGS